MKKTILKIFSNIPIEIIICIAFSLIFIIGSFIFERKEKPSKYEDLEYETVNEISDLEYNINTLKPFVGLTLIFGIVIIGAYIQKNTKIEKGEYEREPKNVIDPILAESIIDGKMQAKDLIMTCIVNLIYKGKLQNINNDYIELIDVKDLSEIEVKVITLLFFTEYNVANYKQLVGKSIKISSISNVFKEENETTLDIYEGLKEIKNKIKNELFDTKIINPIWDFVLQLLRICSILLVLNMIFALGIENSNQFESNIGIIIFLNIVALVVLTISKREIINAKFIGKAGEKTYFMLYAMLSTLMTIIFGLNNIKKLAVYVILIIINLVIIKMSKTYVFTNKGKHEYAKAYMLKKFLKDYSLIEQRDIDGVVLYDEYLVYATAFGMPSKITSKINEALMNLNIELQVIGNILTF